MMMMMILGGVGRVVAGAELENVCERRNEEQYQFQEKFLRSAHAEKKWNDEQELYFN